MLDNRLPKVMLFGRVKGSNPPRKIWNDLVLFDSQQLNIKHPYICRHPTCHMVSAICTAAVVVIVLSMLCLSDASCHLNI